MKQLMILLRSSKAFTVSVHGLVLSRMDTLDVPENPCAFWTERLTSNSHIMDLQGGPLPVINGVMGPL